MASCALSRGSLDKDIVKMRRESRVKTILDAGFLKYGGREKLSFLTLSSAPNSPKSISKSFQALIKRLKRAIPYNYRYVRIKTEEGNGVLHVVLTAPYLPQAMLSRMWEEIHGAKIVDIRQVKTKRLRNYLTPYLQGQGSRLSSSRDWIYLGWRRVYRSIATRFFWHYYPRLLTTPKPFFEYISKLYYFCKIDMLLISLRPLGGEFI